MSMDERLELHQENIKKSCLIRWTKKGLREDQVEEYEYELPQNGMGEEANQPNGVKKTKYIKNKSRAQQVTEIKEDQLEDYDAITDGEAFYINWDEKNQDAEETAPEEEQQEIDPPQQQSTDLNTSHLFQENQEPDEDIGLEKLIEAISGCSIVVGMHPDQAAGAIIDYCLAVGKPFAITPCCVYADQFPKRKLKDGTPVRTDQHFLQYLIEKDPQNILQDTLAFEGKNVVLYSNPSLFVNSIK
uniref:Uncharacterized protein n=1 Tax=Arcella intermedia TaxID=1963864 RepID=A0A6B2LG12_9EUKA